jgi:Flp pilus assembly protein CpaB
MDRRTRGIIIAIVGLIILGIGIVSIRFLIVSNLASPSDVVVPTPSAEQEVVITTRDLDIGQVLNVDDLKKISIPIEAVPWGSISEVENVVGRITKIPLVSGEMILSHHLADPTNISGDIGYIIDDDQVLMAFPSSGLLSSLNILKRGDKVDLLVSMEQLVRVVEDPELVGSTVAVEEEEREETRFVTFNAMQAIELEAVIVNVTYEEENQEAAVPLASVSSEEDEGTEGEEESSQQIQERRPSSINVRAYLLALHPQDALVLKHLLDLGAQFDMVLRAPDNDTIFDLVPVVPDYITDRFDLEIED